MIIVKDAETEQGACKQVAIKAKGGDMLNELTIATHAVFKAISTQAGHKQAMDAVYTYMFALDKLIDEL